MTKFLFFIALLLVLLYQPVVSQTSGKVNWQEFNSLEKLQKSQSKKVLVDVYTDWCGWCKKMDASTFSHPVIIELLDKYFYSVKLNAEKADTILYAGKKFYLPGPGRTTHTLAALLLNGKMSYPSTVFLDESLKSLGPVPGYLEPAMMEKILVYFGENHYKTTDWKVFEKNFKGKIIVQEHGY
jgi:thioredoxin-related protein